MLCKHPEETAAALRRVREEAECVKLGETLGIQSYSQIMIGMFKHLLRIVFGFQYHSQDVIGSLGKDISFGASSKAPRIFFALVIVMRRDIECS